MSTEQQQRSDLHGPSNLLRLYCAALKAKILETSVTDSSWYQHESQILAQASVDLLDAVDRLSVRARSPSSPIA